MRRRRRRVPPNGNVPEKAPHCPVPAPAEEVRCRILRAAEDYFLSNGFSAVTMDVLAVELGMSKKTLYAYFPSKLALLHAVMDQRVASIDQALQRLTQEPGLGFAERVNSAMRYLSGRLGEVKAPFLLDVKRHAPEVFRKVEVFRQQRIPQYFGQLLGEGRRQGMIRPDLEPQVVVAMLLNTVQSLLTPEAVIRLNMPLQQVFQTILRVVFAGLLTTKARNQLRGKEFAFVNQC